MQQNKKKKILILCTGNSCRSQMAQGFALSYGWLAYSAGTKPEIKVNNFAIKVMAEKGINISKHVPESINQYVNYDFDLVATVCDNAKESCPTFLDSCNHTLHQSFEDPAEARGDDKIILEVYRNTRDKIQAWIEKLNQDYLF